MTIFNNRIKDLRDDNDLKQKDIAKVIGINRRTYSSYEISNKIIPLKHLNTLCNFYNVSMDYIFYLSNEKTSNTINKVIGLDKNIIKEKLKEVRLENNLTFRGLAKELNTTPSTLHAYETGKTLILTSFLYQICQKYEISMDWFCGRSNEKYLHKTKTEKNK